MRILTEKFNKRWGISHRSNFGQSIREVLRRKGGVPGWGVGRPPEEQPGA